VSEIKQTAYIQPAVIQKQLIFNLHVRPEMIYLTNPKFKSCKLRT
jgi:hypothetical protein